MLPIAECMVVLALGTSIRAQTEKVDVEALRQKYATSCTGSATSEACKQMRSRLEYALYTGLLLSMEDGETPPPSAIEVGLKAGNPQLRALALQIAPAGPARMAAAVASIDSPYATVRQEAAAVIRSYGDDKQRRMLERQVSGRRPEYPVAETPPDPARLKVKPYPGASYRYFASNDEQAYFSTTDAPDKVVAFYTQGGKKAYSASELKQAMKSRAMGAMDQNKMMQIMQEAQAKGQDPTQAIMAWQKSLAGLGADPTRNVEGREGVVSPRYIPADDMFSRVVVVFRDELVGSTAIVVPLPSPATEAAMNVSGDDVMKTVALQQFMHQPIIDTPPAGE
ncbi:MAG TPA: hypothetical protein VFD38_02130 [Myxococcaceae bacterium]|nr:hypothetical protein [Myxococcaceae bacterium]